MKYYLGNNGQQSGPFELNELLLNGLTPQSLVWCETMTNWTNAMQVPEVAALLQPQMPPQQPQTPPQQPYQQPYGSQPAGAYTAQSKEVGFGDALKICFSKYATFSGRARRSEYWWFYLWFIIISICTCGIGAFVLFIPALAVSVRRLHDTGRSGWWLGGSFILAIVGTVISFLPLLFINSGNLYSTAGSSLALTGIFNIISLAYSIVLLVFYLQDSKPGDNEYGPNPKY